MALEDAFAVLEFAGGVVDLTDFGAVEKTNPIYPLGNGVAVGSGISVDSGSDRSRDTGQGFEAFESAGGGEIDQGLEGRAGI